MVHHRVHRTWRGADRPETLDIIVEAVEEVRAAAPDVGGGRLRDPRAGGSETGVARWSTHLPLDGRAVPRPDERAARAAGDRGQRRERARCSPRRAAGRRGALGTRCCLTLGTGIGGGLLLDGEVYRGRPRARRPRSGTWSCDCDGPDCQGNCPGRGCLEVMASGTAIGREGRRPRRREPDSALGPRAGGRAARSPAAIVTELAHDGDAAAREVLGAIGRRLGLRAGRRS